MRIRTHPGEILREEFMQPFRLSSNALAIALRIPVTRIHEIVRKRRAVTADTALRLARYFGTTPEFWMHLQTAHDLSKASDTIANDIERFIEPRERMAI